MDLLRERRELNQGLGDAFATAFEFAAVTGIFLGLGWLLDRWLGTAPLFMVTLTLFCIIGKSILLMATYNEKMKRHEAERLQRPRGQDPSGGASMTRTVRTARPTDMDVLADDPQPERTVARDLVRHGLVLGPVLILVCGAIWGINGAISAGYAVAIVLVNFLLAAALITWAAPISLPLLMGAVLGGYVLRLGLIFAAVFAVHDASWFEKLPLGLTIVVTHLVLLIWELRYVSASLAFPGLKPSPVTPTR